MGESNPDQAIALVALTKKGAALARHLQQHLPAAQLYAPATLEGDITFERIGECLTGLFRAGRPIVGICASGILIRLLAPLLTDKHVEPPVLALAEDGSAVVPLLGGHRGANALARRLGEILCVAPAVTTAGDLSLGFALDEPPQGWRIADEAAIKPVAASLLAGETVSLIIEAGDASWLSSLPTSDAANRTIRVTHRRSADAALTYHPPVLAIGAGCARGAAAADMIALAERSLAQAGLSPLAVGIVVSHEIKVDEPAVLALAQHFGVPARFFDAPSLLAQTERLTSRSEAVFKVTGCWGVAEGAALAAAGTGGCLVVPKQIGQTVTIALAFSRTDLDPTTIGHAQGRLYIVGIGPGSAEWRTPEAESAIKASRHLVGYGLYLDLLEGSGDGKTRHETGLGHEEARARRALELAAEGHTVSLICSGDAGIYALATLVFELLERGGEPRWKRVTIQVVPGISALQAAAARAGAPLGHDFCTISLSDLLTPWQTIEARLQAATAADFVIALYNPRSERRVTQLVRAIEIFRAHRASTTPVILARNLGREEERVQIIDLASFEAEMVDMLTLVLIGNSETRIVDACRRWAYTPRGYAGKSA